MNHKEQILGYKRKSPFKTKPFIDIYSDRITMNGVDKDLILIPDNGSPVVAKAESGDYFFPKAKKVREIPYQKGGERPVSPFTDLNLYKNKYKMRGDEFSFQYGGILEDYIKTLPPEQQPDFINEFTSLEPDVQQEVIKFMCGGKYQMGGLTEVDINNIEEGTFYVPDDRVDILNLIKDKGYAYYKL